MSRASSLRASSAVTIGRASRAGSRFAEQASWLRTSTLGSIAARRASAVGHSRGNVGGITQQTGRPEPRVWIGMVERLQGRRFIQTADQVQCPERLKGELAGFSRDHVLESGATERIFAVAN